MAEYRHILPPASLRSSTPLVNEGGKRLCNKLQFESILIINMLFNKKPQEINSCGLNLNDGFESNQKEKTTSPKRNLSFLVRVTGFEPAAS